MATLLVPLVFLVTVRSSGTTAQEGRDPDLLTPHPSYGGSHSVVLRREWRDHDALDGPSGDGPPEEWSSQTWNAHTARLSAESEPDFQSEWLEPTSVVTPDSSLARTSVPYQGPSSLLSSFEQLTPTPVWDSLETVPGETSFWTQSVTEDYTASDNCTNAGDSSSCAGASSLIHPDGTPSPFLTSEFSDPHRSEFSTADLFVSQTTQEITPSYSARDLTLASDSLESSSQVWTTVNSDLSSSRVLNSEVSPSYTLPSDKALSYAEFPSSDSFSDWYAYFGTPSESESASEWSAMATEELTSSSLYAEESITAQSSSPTENPISSDPSFIDSPTASSFFPSFQTTAILVPTAVPEQSEADNTEPSSVASDLQTADDYFTQLLESSGEPETVSLKVSSMFSDVPTFAEASCMCRPSVVTVTRTVLTTLTTELPEHSRTTDWQYATTVIDSDATLPPVFDLSSNVSEAGSEQTVTCTTDCLPETVPPDAQSTVTACDESLGDECRTYLSPKPVLESADTENMDGVSTETEPPHTSANTSRGGRTLQEDVDTTVTSSLDEDVSSGPVVPASPDPTSFVTPQETESNLTTLPTPTIPWEDTDLIHRDALLRNEAYWVRTVVRGDTRDWTEEVWNHLEDRLSKIYYLACVRLKDPRNRNRRSVPDINITLVGWWVNLSAQHTDILYTVIKDGLPLLSSPASDLLRAMPTDEVRDVMNLTVLSGATPYRVWSSERRSVRGAPHWAVLVAVGAAGAVLALMLCLGVVCYRSHRRNRQVLVTDAEDESLPASSPYARQNLQQVLHEGTVRLDIGNGSPESKGQKEPELEPKDKGNGGGGASDLERATRQSKKLQRSLLDPRKLPLVSEETQTEIGLDNPAFEDPHAKRKGHRKGHRANGKRHLSEQQQSEAGDASTLPSGATLGQPEERPAAKESKRAKGQPPDVLPDTRSHSSDAVQDKINELVDDTLASAAKRRAYASGSKDQRKRPETASILPRSVHSPTSRVGPAPDDISEKEHKSPAGSEDGQDQGPRVVWTVLKPGTHHPTPIPEPDSTTGQVSSSSPRPDPLFRQMSRIPESKEPSFPVPGPRPRTAPGEAGPDLDPAVRPTTSGGPGSKESSSDVASPSDAQDEVDVVCALRLTQPPQAVIHAIRQELKKFNTSMPGTNTESLA